MLAAEYFWGAAFYLYDKIHPQIIILRLYSCQVWATPLTNYGNFLGLSREMSGDIRSAKNGNVALDFC